jgi:hypothetical protein
LRLRLRFRSRGASLRGRGLRMQGREERQQREGGEEMSGSICAGVQFAHGVLIGAQRSLILGSSFQVSAFARQSPDVWFCYRASLWQ